MVSEKAIISELVLVSSKELLVYPRITSSKWAKQMLRNIYYAFTGQDQIKIDRYSWPNAMMALALSLVSNIDDLETTSIVQTYMDRWISSGQKIHTVDNLMNGMSLISLLEETGDPKYRTALDKLVKYVRDYKKSTEGTIPYRQKNTEAIYVDSIGILCPFLFRYAEVYHDESIRALAINQIESFILNGIDATTGLPVHGYLSDTKIKMGIVGWGRGVGWYLCGLADSLNFIDKNSYSYDLISNELAARLNVVLKYQYADGYFCWQLGLDRGQNDISATAMILYATARAVSLGIVSLSQIESSFEKGVNAIKTSFLNGKINDCSAECGGFSVYPQIYGSYPWGFAPALAFLILLEKIQR